MDIQTQIQELIEAENYECADIELKELNKSVHFVILLDKEGGVTLADCVAMNKKIDAFLTKQRFANMKYTLEVNSPGLDRRLKKEKDFIKYIGKKIWVRTNELIDGKKVFIGTLKDYKDSKVELFVDEEKQSRTFALTDIQKARLFI